MSASYSVNSDSSAEKFPVDKSGFVFYKKKIESFLDVRDLSIYITDIASGSDTKSESESNGSKIDVSKERRRTYNIILQTLSNDQMMLCNDVKAGDAFGLWKKLNDVYGTVRTTDSLASIMHQLSSMTKPKHESIKEYLGKFGMQISKLHELNETVSDKMKKYYILSGLSKSAVWSSTTELVNGLDKDGQWTLDQLETYLISQESKLLMKYANNNSNNNNNNNAYSSFHRGRGGRGRGRGGFRGNQRQDHDKTGQDNKDNNENKKKEIICYKCQKPGHRSFECDEKQKVVKCYKCGVLGHKSPQCPKNNNGNNSNIADASLHTKYYDSDEGYPSIVCDDECQCLSGHDRSCPDKTRKLTDDMNDEWILDSGATKHYTYNKKLLYNIRPIEKNKNNRIKTANGYSYYNVHGEVDLYMNGEQIVLREVAYVKDFTSNLLSVSKITDGGGIVVFTSEGSLIKSKNKKNHKIPRVGNLYKLSSSNDVSLSVQDDNLLKETKIKLKLLHEMYGHVNYTKLYDMLSHECLVQGHDWTRLVTSLNKNKNINIKHMLTSLSHEQCEGCLKGKFHRLPMTGKKNHHAEEIMDLWFCDTVGPISVESIGGAKYSSICLDAASSKPMCEITNDKSVIARTIIARINVAQTHTGKTLKKFHSDGGTEIVTTELKEFLEKNGTEFTTTVPDTPQDNGKVERSNRTHIEMTKCMMHHCKCYSPLWAEAFMCASYIIERTVTAKNKTKTPYEIWYNRKPNVKNFHVFGSDVYYLKHEKDREYKFDETSLKGIFVGYDQQNEYYYRIYDVKTFRVYRVKHVKFFDNSFAEMKRLVYTNNDGSNDILNDIFKEYESLPDNISAEDISEMFATKNNEESGRVQVVTGQDPVVSIQESDMNSEVRINSDTTINDSINNVVVENVSNNNNINNNNNISNNNISNRSTRVRNAPNRYEPEVFKRYTHDTAQAASTGDIPVTYKQALSSPEAPFWITAIGKEYSAHVKNNTWSEVERQKNMNVIGCRYVFNKKKDVNGDVKEYKARLVAKGFSQQYGIDYHDTFAPVLKYKSLRLIFALSVITGNTNLNHLDVKTAFLNANVTENIYMELPDGFYESCPVVSGQHPVKTQKSGGDIVLKLNKALYGIKQAPKEWNSDINEYVVNTLKFKRCIKDTCVYVKKSKNNNNLIIGLFVDDTITSHNDEDKKEYDILMNLLKSKYEMSDLGEVSHVLGMRVRKVNGGLFIDQQTYIDEKLKQFNMNECKTTSTPESLDKLIKNKNKNDVENENGYRSIVGSEIYASMSTRPDITHAVNMVSRHMHEPNASHMNAAKRILRYLKENNDVGLLYSNNSKNSVVSGRDRTRPKNEVKISAYCDADWGGDWDDGKSTTGYCVFINDCLISWCTHKQPTVAHSSAEAELMGAVDVVKEVKWLKQLVEEMNYKVITPIVINIDNQSAISIAENDVSHARTKHINIKYHSIKNDIDEKSNKYLLITKPH